MFKTDATMEDLSGKVQIIDDIKNIDEKSIANKRGMNFDPTIEPLLKDNPRRFVIFPIEYHDIWQFYKKVRFWFGKIFKK